MVFVSEQVTEWGPYTYKVIRQREEISDEDEGKERIRFAMRGTYRYIPGLDNVITSCPRDVTRDRSREHSCDSRLSFSMSKGQNSEENSVMRTFRCKCRLTSCS